MNLMIVFIRQAWDLAVDICLSQLPDVIENLGNFKVCAFLFTR